MSTLICMTKSERSNKKTPKIEKIQEKMQRGELKEFCIENNVLKLGHRLFVPEVIEISEEIMKEAHCTPNTAHPESTKMYQNLRYSFWWDRMKKNIAEYVHKCLVCQQVKAEHKKPP